MSANTFNTTAKKRQKSADEIIAAEAKKEALRLKHQPTVDEQMQALHAKEAATARCCTHCKQTLPAVMFGKDKSRRDGIAARCKPCNRLHVKGLKGYVKKEYDPSLTPPRVVNVMDGVYVPARDTYYRNDGLKHIKSVGF
jgi:hypothetical protein